MTSKLTFWPVAVEAADVCVASSIKERVVAGVAPTFSFCCC